MITSDNNVQSIFPRYRYSRYNYNNYRPSKYIKLLLGSIQYNGVPGIFQYERGIGGGKYIVNKKYYTYIIVLST